MVGQAKILETKIKPNLAPFLVIYFTNGQGVGIKRKKSLKIVLKLIKNRDKNSVKMGQMDFEAPKEYRKQRFEIFTNVMEFGDIDSQQCSDLLNISPEAAQMKLLRLFRSRWLNRYWNGWKYVYYISRKLEKSYDTYPME